MMRKEKLLFVGSAGLVGLSCMQLAHSQSAETADRLEEVIVTATKREQSVQEVPQAVQVIGADELTSASIHEFSDLTRIAASMVIKPAETTPLTDLRVSALFLEAGLPKGVLNVVTGRGSVIGEEIVSNSKVRKIGFTGSTEVGRQVMASACQVSRTGRHCARMSPRSRPACGR